MHLILLGIITTTLYLFIQAEREECDNHIKPNGRWEKSCEPKSRTQTYCRMMMKNSPKCMKKDCYKKARNYFNLYRQDKSSVRKFTANCKSKMRADWDYCLDILLYFQSYPYCWTMFSLSSLLLIFDKNELLKKKELEKIQISKSEFDSFSEAKLGIYSCKDDLNMSFKRTKATMNEYIKIRRQYSKEFSETSNVCNCVLVLGIKRLSKKLEENLELHNRSENESTHEVDIKGSDEETVLEYMYYHICFNDNDLEKRKHWTKEKIEILINESNDLSIMNAILLLKFGTCLVAAGWYKENNSKTHWPLKYLLPKITNKKGKITNELEYFSKIIGSGFSTKNYDDYISLLGRTKGFSDKKCVQGIMKTFLEVEYEFNDHVSHKKALFWKRVFQKERFLTHLELLIKMFTDSGGVLCNNFMTHLREIEDVVKQCPWSISDTNELIALALTKKMTIQELPNTLLFYISFKKAVKKFKAEEHSDISWPPNDATLLELREKVFANAAYLAGIGHDERELMESDFDTLVHVYWSIESL